jgi:hypothetical protein
VRQWFRIDAAWVARRATLLEAQEDAAIRAALEGAEGEEKALIERVLLERAKNCALRQRAAASNTAGDREPGGTDRT